jgi:hypothetical protein
MWQVDEPIRDGAYWRATIFEIERDGKRTERGTVVMSHAHKIISAETNLILAAEP